MIKQLRVSSSTSVPDLSGSITNNLKTYGEIEARSIGASSTNQLVKAVASSTGHLKEEDKSIDIHIGFDLTNHDGREKTVMVFRLKLKDLEV